VGGVDLADEVDDDRLGGGPGTVVIVVKRPISDCGACAERWTFPHGV
jgi:hypothetical protein